MDLHVEVESLIQQQRSLLGLPQMWYLDFVERLGKDCPRNWICKGTLKIVPLENKEVWGF